MVTEVGRRARRGGAGRADDRPAGAPGRARRGVRRAGAGDPQRARRPRDRRSFLTEDPTDQGGRAACARSAAQADPVDPHLRGQGRPGRAAARDAPGRHRDRPDGGRRGRDHQPAGLGRDPAGRRAGGLGGRPGRPRRWRCARSTCSGSSPPTWWSRSGVEPGDIVVTAGRSGPAPGPEGPAAGGRAHDRLQPVGLGAAQPLGRRLPDAPRGGRRRARLRQARPQRGPRLHHPHHGGGGRLAGRHARRDHCSRSPSGSSASCRRCPGLDVLRSYTQPGRATIFVDLLGSVTGGRGAGHLAAGAQRRQRRLAHAARGAWSGRSSTTASATCSASSTASPPTASPTASCATMSSRSAPSCCTCPTSRRSTSSAPRTR